MNFLFGPPPQPVYPLSGAQLGHPEICHVQLLSFTCNRYLQMDAHVLTLDLENKMFKYYVVLALGSLPLKGCHGGYVHHLNDFASSTLKNDFCKILSKSNCAFLKKKMKMYKVYGRRMHNTSLLEPSTQVSQKWEIWHDKKGSIIC